MPVRIYDISKKLGLENKEVLAKAKAMGIAAAKVASSSLDKITAEYLELQILQERPDLAAKLAAPPVSPPSAAPAALPEVAIVVAAPPTQDQRAPQPEAAPATATALLERGAAPATGSVPLVQAEVAGPATAVSEPPS